MERGGVIPEDIPEGGSIPLRIPLKLSSNPDFQGMLFDETVSSSSLYYPSDNTDYHQIQDTDTVPDQYSNQEIYLGEILSEEKKTSVIFHDPKLATRHRGTPWLYDYLKNHEGVELDQGATSEPGSFSVTDKILGHHALVVGKPGSGKSRMIYEIIKQHILTNRSIFMIEMKEDGVEHILAVYEDIKNKHPDFPMPEITLVLPGQKRSGVPSWNPFLGDPDDIRGNVTGFADIMDDLFGGWGPRTNYLFKTAATVAASLGLTLYEVRKMLQRDEYLSALLEQAKGTPAWSQNPGAFEYFQEDYLKLGKADRKSIVQPLMSKIDELVNNPFLRAMLCGERDDLDLRSLWYRPRLLIVHLDKTNQGLGKDGARILGGLLISAMYKTALSQKGRVPVLMSLDEIGVTGKSLGSSIPDILATARSKNLRMLFACQYTKQLGPELKEAVSTSNGFQAYFHVGPADAREVAEMMPLGRGSKVEKLSIEVQDEEKRYSYRYTVRDGDGYPLMLSDQGFDYLRKMQLNPPETRTRTELYEVFAAVMYQSDLDPNDFFIYNPVGGPVVPVNRLLKLPPEDWRFLLSNPLRVEVSVPKLKVNALEKPTLTDRKAEVVQRFDTLENRTALMKTETSAPVWVKVLNVDIPHNLPNPEHYLTGQSAEEISRRFAWQEQMIDQITATVKPVEDEVKPTKKPVKTVKEEPPQEEDGIEYV